MRLAPSPATPARRNLGDLVSSRPAWVLLLGLAVAFFVVGSIHPPRSSAAARVARLESVIKCPSCDDLSIAQSDAAGAVALRERVEQFVADGWSDARVESWVVDRYGSDSLLLPPTSGVSAALYLVPLAALALAGGALATYLWRRRTGADGRASPGGASRQ